MWESASVWHVADANYVPGIHVYHGLSMDCYGLKLNPFYYIVAGYRDSILTGNWFWERPTLTVYFWGVTFILMFLGLKVFRKLRPHFSDVM